MLHLKKIQALSFFLLLFFACDNKADSLTLQTENPDGSKSPKIQVELAYEEATRTKGLMYRKTMAEDEGMLFLFPFEAERAFWMKNTYLALDIIYFDREFKVVSISKNARPHTTTPRKSDGMAQYVLEVNAGLADKWGLTKGSKLVVEGELPEAK